VPSVVAEIEYGIQRIEPSSRKRAGLERDGEMIDDFDVAIAAIAMSHDAGVVTANLAHFSRVRGLSCRHWTE
jgi:predicted nucleic acid-binding protein